MPSGVYKRKPLTKEHRENIGKANRGNQYALDYHHTKEAKIKIGKAKYKHGEAIKGKVTKLHKVWTGMKSRCFNPKHKDYKNYGGRGITVCDSWKNSYIAFRDWSLKNGYKKELTIDRINNDGNYEPSNCQFITRTKNTKKGNYERWKKYKKETK